MSDVLTAEEVQHTAELSKDPRTYDKELTLRVPALARSHEALRACLDETIRCWRSCSRSRRAESRRAEHLDSQGRALGEKISELSARAVAAEAEVARLTEAVEHVVNDSPGTPESVKSYLRAALSAPVSTPGFVPYDERPKCQVCNRPAGPFGSCGFPDFCACDQRNGSTFAAPVSTPNSQKEEGT